MAVGMGSRRDDSSTLIFVNDGLAAWLRDRFEYGPPGDLSFDDIFGCLVDALRKPTALQETPFSYGDLQPLLGALKSKGRLAGPGKLEDFHYPWIKMTDTFSVSRSLKTDDPYYPSSQPHCRFLCYKEGPAVVKRPSGPTREAHATLLVGTAVHIIPRVPENLLDARSADHHIEYVLDKLAAEEWDSATRDFVELITYHLAYPKQFVDSSAQLESVFRVIHRGTYPDLYGRDWSVVLGLPVYVVAAR